MDYARRLRQAIPGGAHTYSRGFDQFPSNAPPILHRGSGAWAFPPTGKKLLDYGMGLRSVGLGYGNKTVTRHVIEAIRLGNSLTLPHKIELTAAEKAIELFPGVEMVKFAKNGSNATTAATKLARAYTGRVKIAAPAEQPFFSFDDWFIGSTPVSRGIPASVREETLRFRYGDIASLQDLFSRHPEQISCVIMEPLTHQTPCSSHDLSGDWQSTSGPCKECSRKKKNYLSEVKKLCEENGTLLILDEMITGFRWSTRGAAHDFGVVPDITTFGKAIANGFSLAFVGGRRDIMELGSIDKEGVERTFLLSSTHGAEMSALGAFLGTSKVYEKKNIVNHLWAYGARLREGMTILLQNFGLQENIYLSGPDCLLSLSFQFEESDRAAKVKTLYLQEMVSNGVLMPWIAPSYSHGEKELKLTFRAMEKVLPVVRDAVVRDDFSKLKGPHVKPVFRQFN